MGANWVWEDQRSSYQRVTSKESWPLGREFVPEEMARERGDGR